MAIGTSERINLILNKTTSVGATTAWLTMAVLTFIDVVGREVFSTPIPGGYEIIQVMMAIGIFFSLPIVALRMGHVKVELLRKVFSERMLLVTNGAARIASILFFGYLGYCLVRLTMHAFSTGVRTAYLSIPHWYVALLMAVFLVVTTICCIYARETEADILEEGDI